MNSGRGVLLSISSKTGSRASIVALHSDESPHLKNLKVDWCEAHDVVEKRGMGIFLTVLGVPTNHTTALPATDKVVKRSSTDYLPLFGTHRPRMSKLCSPEKLTQTHTSLENFAASQNPRRKLFRIQFENDLKIKIPSMAKIKKKKSYMLPNSRKSYLKYRNPLQKNPPSV